MITTKTNMKIKDKCKHDDKDEDKYTYKDNATDDDKDNCEHKYNDKHSDK